MKVVGVVHNCRKVLPAPCEEFAGRVVECDCGRLWSCQVRRRTPLNFIDPPSKRTRWNRREWAEYEAAKARWEQTPPHFLWDPYEGPVDPA